MSKGYTDYDSDDETTSSEEDEYMPKKQKTVSTPVSQPLPKLVPRVPVPQPSRPNQIKVEQEPDQTELFIRRIKDPEVAKVLRENQSLIAHYNCADRALEAVRSLQSRDANIEFFKALEGILENEEKRKINYH